MDTWNVLIEDKESDHKFAIQKSNRKEMQKWMYYLLWWKKSRRDFVRSLWSLPTSTGINWIRQLTGQWILCVEASRLFHRNGRCFVMETKSPWRVRSLIFWNFLPWKRKSLSYIPIGINTKTSRTQNLILIISFTAMEVIKGCLEEYVQNL